MLDIDYSLWDAGAATGRHGEKKQSTANDYPPHHRFFKVCGSLE
jgi:hypothetical protein